MALPSESDLLILKNWLGIDSGNQTWSQLAWCLVVSWGTSFSEIKEDQDTPDLIRL